MRIDDLQAQFDAALAEIGLDPSNPIGLAVSGGGDSTALLHFAAASNLIDNTRLRVFTFDHGLRAEAADEAAFVNGLCTNIGVAHETLRWSDPNPSQAHARGARHRLLAAAFREAGGNVLLTGHTLSDNVESFLIRARAASGWYGLSGMGPRSASPVWPEGEGVVIGRPMLNMARDKIRAWLRAKGHAWCDDSSNENVKYERVRMRGLLAGAPERSARIARIQAKLSQMRRARDTALGAWLSSAATETDVLTLPIPETISAEALAQGIAFAAMAASGTDQPPRTQRSRSAAEKLQSANSLTLTLGGAVIQKRGDTLTFVRESNRPPGESTVRPSLRLQHICAGLTGETSG